MSAFARIKSASPPIPDIPADVHDFRFLVLPGFNGQFRMIRLTALRSQPD